MAASAPFIWQGNTGQTSTPEDVNRQRKIAAALMQRQPTATNPWDGISQVTAALSGSLLNGRADAAQQAGTDAGNSAFSGLSDGQGTPDEIIAALTNPWTQQNPGQSAVAAALMKQQMAQQDPATQLEMDLKRAQIAKAQKGGDQTYFGNGVPIQLSDGTIQYGQFGSQGGFNVPQLPDGAHFLTPAQQLNTGTEFTGVDKFGNRTGGTVGINNQGAEFDKSLGTSQGKQAADLPMLQSKATGSLNALERKTQFVGQTVDKAITQATTGFPTTGLFSLAKAVPGQPAYDLAQTLNTIKANIGFDTLAEMRQNSPTGGALGSISDTENLLLQAVDGAITQEQSQPQLIDNLKHIKELQAQVLAEKKAAFGRDFGGQQQAPQAGQAPTQHQAPAAVGGIPTQSSGAVYTDPKSGVTIREIP